MCIIIISENIYNFLSTDSRDLTASIDYMGDTYNQIGEMYAKQPEKDIDPTHDMLYEYKGILSVFPDVLKVHEVRLGVNLIKVQEVNCGKFDQFDQV